MKPACRKTNAKRMMKLEIQKPWRTPPIRHWTLGFLSSSAIRHALFGAALAAASLLLGCRGERGKSAAEPNLPAAAVRAQTVEAKKHVVTEETVGTVRAKLQARLEAKVPGRIQEMRAVPGQLVKAGELLVRLDAQEIHAKLDQALAVRQQAESDLKRFTALLDRAAATQAEFDAVQARARVAEAAVREAQTMVSNAEIMAPFAGVVTRKLADVGDLAVPGKPLLDLEDPAHLRLETDISEAIIGAVKLGATMPVGVSGGAGELQGAVSEIAPSADPNSRTFRVKLDLPSAQGLRAGQFGRVAVPVAETTALRVPASALVQRGQLHLVFVVSDKRAVMRLVKPGKRIGEEVEIASGLSPGENVVIENAASLLDGQPVETK
ncbi:MAG: efflux RND transporter periplasmic adaptor subunit [Verrucomicrobia bacterium]|nr:efflux RND transporter periplasmic adaptor subunit [Verrucomicrobiota bacterium]